MKILIDEEFKRLIPPLTSDEIHHLEENILKEGCRDPLILWKGSLNIASTYLHFWVDFSETMQYHNL